MQLAIIRAGETEYDRQQRVQGTLDIPLTPEGEAAVAKMVDELEPIRMKAIYAANCAAAVQTASIIAARLGLKPRRLDALGNVRHGLWEGMLVEEIKRKHPRVYRQWQDDPETVCPPEGELLGDARGRIEQALRKLQRKHRQDCIALVAPEPLATLIACQLTGHPVAEHWPVLNAPPSWELIKLEEQNAPAP